MKTQAPAKLDCRTSLDCLALYDKKVSEQTAYRSMLHMGQCSHRPVSECVYNRHVSIRTGPWNKDHRKRWPGLMNFLFDHVDNKVRCLPG